MKVYTIIKHKSKKVRLQLLDSIVFAKKSDAKKYLKDIIKDLKKEEKCALFKDGNTYIVTENETGEEHSLYIEELDFRE